MHLFFENIAGHMYKHWTGKFFKNDDLNREEFILSENTYLFLLYSAFISNSSNN